MKTENRILFTSIPKLAQLKYFLGVIDFTEKPFSNVFSDYNWQKIKTRSLLENHSDILAAPVQRRISEIYLIFPETCSEEDLKNFMTSNKISLNGPFSLDNNVYLECILYSLTFRLSDWKRVNKYFVRGEHFLNYSGAVDAVQLQLLITDGCLAFSTCALRLKLPSISLIDLGVDLKGLFREGFAVVRQKVLTLPNLKQATAVCVHLDLPISCTFRNYDDMKNHWKKLYGYNLPQRAEGMLFVEVVFNRSNFTYVYPIVCVCPFEPIQLKSKDELKLINDFADALKIDFPKICGHHLKVNMKNDNIFHPISKLYLASEVIDKPNLSLLVADNKVVENFQKENLLPQPSCKSKKRCHSPPLFFPTFERISLIPPPKPSNEPFKCFPIFRPKPTHKLNTYSQNSKQSKKSRTSTTNSQGENLKKIEIPNPKQAKETSLKKRNRKRN